MTDITQLLRGWSNGIPNASEQVMSLVYSELRRLAGRQLSAERQDHTLQVTGLVNEAWLRLSEQRIEWVDRRQFLSIAAQLMRRILVDHARRQQASKRPPPDLRMSIDDVDPMALRVDQNLIVLDEALEALDALDARQARIVELRFFVGLDIEETAQAMQLSVSTVTREWRMARAWLHRRLQA
jgi:RNA polymerase sigma factor (TIGR02999 family)